MTRTVLQVLVLELQQN